MKDRPSTAALQVLALSLALVGCASSAAPRGASTTPQAEARMSALTAASDAQNQRIAELEARIALLEQEARRAKDPGRSKETVRIGEHRRDEPRGDASAEAARPSSKSAREPVAVIRLHEAEAASPETPWVLPSAPAGVATSLDVVPIIDDAAKLELGAMDPTARYREALSLLKARRFDDALAQLALFTREHPDHALIPQALYWKGEAHYAARRYREALIELEAFIKRFPTSNKVPDALLKAGLCNQRLGQAALAERYFDQVRKEHPGSAAAQNAPREGSS